MSVLIDPNFLATVHMIPHGHCYLWQTDLVALHVASDALIAIAYYSIPLALLVLVLRRDDLPFNWIFVMFGAFILACGTTHLMGIWTLWHPDYWVSGVLKAGTALVSVATAATTVPTIQQVLKLPQLMDIEVANQRLRQEIEERKRIEKELSKEKELAQVTLKSIGDAVITTDAAENVAYINPVAEQLTGWSLAAAKGMPLGQVFTIIDEQTRQQADNSVSTVLRTGKLVEPTNHTALISKDGSEYSITDSAAPIKDKDGAILGAVLVFHDVTESRALSQRLAWQASHDELTGLKNRRHFELELNMVLRTSQQDHVLCYLDLDQFKVVNDTCGHAAGDELLKQIGAILGQYVRSDDVVARLGGDEFGIVLCDCPLKNARRAMELIRQAIQDFRFAWQGKTFGIAVSIGVVELNAGIGNLADALGAADAACYGAKERGRNRIYIYRADDQQLSEQRSQQEWIARIRLALDENQFQLYQQPIASASCGEGHEMHHHEILLRLLDTTGTVILPMAFIPAAERYGLMPAIDRWVIKACFAYMEQRRAGDNGSGAIAARGMGFYAINLSGASINDEQFLPFLMEQIKRSSMPPEALCFEITETVAVSNLNKAREFIGQVKALGCSFALDDFGSGMSSFGYLHHLAVNYVKIDGSFVRNLMDDTISTSIVEAITKVVHAMGLKTIAEQVEDRQTQQKLQRLGVDYVQGYGIGRPAPLTQQESSVQIPVVQMALQRHEG
ncbi:MAG: EAL domain-containing protein [Elainellaceae cyanobacterium]